LITPVFLVIFFGLLLVFHVMQMFAALFGPRMQKRALDLMNLGIIWNIRFVSGASFTVHGVPSLPAERPVIIVANHQSMYDIPMIMWLCRKRELGFIAKKELGRWIPSISLALRRLGSVLIDRKDTRKAISAIESFGAYKERVKQVACIFPEGTRARDGKMKKFKATGLQALLRTMPSAVIQPIAIKGNWELLRHNLLPVVVGSSIELSFLALIEPSSYPPEAVVEMVEGRIRAVVGGDKAALTADQVCYEGLDA
jgi:1-acyl-sn-glycerol-3-phosphate acyltransferase